MSDSIVLLTEQALAAADAQRLAGLHDGENPRIRVLVPADIHRNLLADVLDHLSLLELREALGAVTGRDENHPRPEQSLAATLTELQTVGLAAVGEVVHGDPVDCLKAELDKGPADEVVIVTRPHAVEDTFHLDWASRARERLGVPVLHVYAGSSWLG